MILVIYKDKALDYLLTVWFFHSFDHIKSRQSTPQEIQSTAARMENLKRGGGGLRPPRILLLWDSSHFYTDAIF